MHSPWEAAGIKKLKSLRNNNILFWIISGFIMSIPLIIGVILLFVSLYNVNIAHLELDPILMEINRNHFIIAEEGGILNINFNVSFNQLWRHKNFEEYMLYLFEKIIGTLFITGGMICIPFASFVIAVNR